MEGMEWLLTHLFLDGVYLQPALLVLHLVPLQLCLEEAGRPPLLLYLAPEHVERMYSIGEISEMEFLNGICSQGFWA